MYRIYYHENKQWTLYCQFTDKRDTAKEWYECSAYHKNKRKMKLTEEVTIIDETR